jgi:hypothetical protein
MPAQSKHLGYRKCPIEKSLATLKPDVAAQWHPFKNGDLNPEQVSPGSKLKVWWLCDKACDGTAGCGQRHEYLAEIKSKVLHGTAGCGICHNLAICPIGACNSLAKQDPITAAQWHPTKNGNLRPEHVTPGSNTKVWWQCDNSCNGPNGCNTRHVYLSTVKDKVKRGADDGCSVCHDKSICPVGFCNSLFGKRPDMAAIWHPTKNGDLKPTEVSKTSDLQVWWLCAKGCPGCDVPHEWQASPHCVSLCHGGGCPFCANRRICVNCCNSLEKTKPALAALWHPTKNGDLKPSQVSICCAKRVWFQCDKVCACGEYHEWNAQISSASGCPICNAKQICHNFCNSLDVLRPDIAAQWHETKNGDLRPHHVAVGSDKKVWWRCPDNPKHDPWQTVVDCRTRKYDGATGCPCCKKSKGEMAVKLALNKFGMDYAPQFAIRASGATKKPCHVDYVVPSKKTAIEFDGKQHFELVGLPNWDKGFVDRQGRDRRKDWWCVINGFICLHIHWRDFADIQCILGALLRDNRDLCSPWFAEQGISVVKIHLHPGTMVYSKSFPRDCMLKPDDMFPFANLFGVEP